VDADGSETLTFRISMCRPAGSFNVGTNAGGGVWTFTAAQVAGGISFNPPAQAYGTYNMTLRATATEHTVAGESTADDVATKDATITVVVAPCLDVPAIGTASSTGQRGHAVQPRPEYRRDDCRYRRLAEPERDVDRRSRSGRQCAPTWTNASGVTVTNNGGGSYTVAGCQRGDRADGAEQLPYHAAQEQRRQLPGRRFRPRPWKRRRQHYGQRHARCGGSRRGRPALGFDRRHG
jgi:hypothetical protein